MGRCSLDLIMSLCRCLCISVFGQCNHKILVCIYYSQCLAGSVKFCEGSVLQGREVGRPGAGCSRQVVCYFLCCVICLKLSDSSVSLQWCLNSGLGRNFMCLYIDVRSWLVFLTGDGCKKLSFSCETISSPALLA